MNSALIGYTYDGITISFRGTQNSSLLDWLQNAALFLSDVTEENSLKIQGKVHNGFFRGTKSLWKPIKSLLKEMLQECEANGWSTNIYLTGHSKGGAMASIAAMLMVRDSDLPDPTHVVTFASARVGDSKFRDVYNQKVNQTSYEAHLDLVPFLPPSSTTMDVMGEKM
jgi:predicted lipase